MAEMDPGTEFGGYRIERLLGAGGFCHVYLAEDLRPALRRKVALKVLNPTLSADDKNRERFQRESLLAVELDDHPNIVGVLDAGEADGQLFIAQRYIDGRDLGDTIEADGPLSPERAVEVITEIAGALDAAHEAGLVHRDVKPRNILIRDRDGRCFLADFGLTKRTAASDSLTGAGEFLGTFAYAAPEQLGGQDVDGRADLYALGCVLFESLMAAPPFSGDIHSMITSHLTKPPPAVSGAQGLPPAIDAVITKAMAKEPDDRYQTGAELAEATRRALLTSGLAPPVAVAPPPPPTAQTVQTPAPAPPPAGVPQAPSSSGTAGSGSRLPLLVGGVVGLVLVVVGAVVLFGGGGDDGPPVTTVDEDAVALEEAQDAADEIVDELPAALADDCDLADVEDNDRGVVAELECDPADGADTVEITAYEDDDDLDDAFSDAQSSAAEELDTGADCVTARYAVHSWTTADDPEGVAGQVACYRDDAEQAALAWTVTDLDLIAVAARDDSADAALYEWWAGIVDRSEPATVDDFPNPGEAELLAHVPEDLRGSCIRAELRPTESASVQCFPAQDATTVFYNQFANPAAVTAQYDALREANGVARDTGEANGCPVEDSLVIDEQPSGRVFCALRDDGGHNLVWTNRSLAILAEASNIDGPLRRFWDWWTTAGPIP